MRGRKSRLNRFEVRANAFAKAQNNPKTQTHTIRDKRGVWVGTGNHRRLIFKRDLPETLEAEGRLRSHLSKNQPKKFVLVPVAGKVMEGEKMWRHVQEYFHRPTVDALQTFFRLARTRKGFHELGRDDYFLAKRLVREFPGISDKILREAFNELSQAHWKVGLFPYPQNIVVVGQTPDGRLRFAFVDV